MVYVTHDQVEAMTLADRIVVLRAGRIEQVGTPTELYEDPANIFVAGVIGSPKMNLLKDGVSLSVGGVSFRPADLDLPKGEVTVGLRPEQFDETASEGTVFEIAVRLVENLGGTSIVHGTLSDGQDVLIEQRGAGRVKAGEVIEGRFDADRILVFDGGGHRVWGGSDGRPG